MSTQFFLTVIESGPSSFGAFAPDLLGCIAFSESREELTLLFKLAAEAHCRELRQLGRQIPEATTKDINGVRAGVLSGEITLEWTEIEMPDAA